MTRLRHAAIVFTLLGAAVVARAQTPAPDPRLTIADVEKVSGQSGVKQVRRASVPAAGGDLNFVGPDGKLLLMVNFGSAALYDSAKKKTTTFHAVIRDLGDDAFDAPPGNMQYVLYVKKGANAVSLTSYLGSTRPLAPKLTLDQLKALARIVL